MKIYYNQEAKEVFNEIIENPSDGNYNIDYPSYFGSVGLFIENDKVIAFDNTDGCCWVEEFESESEARNWLNI